LCSLQCNERRDLAGEQAPEDEAKTCPFAWTFLPFIERKCHKGRFDQILCRTQSGRRDEACANIYANTVIANNLWRVLRSTVPPPANQLFGVAIGGGMAHPTNFAA
jgi:hypothetical protein